MPSFGPEKEAHMETLRAGGRAIPVKLLQRLLNRKGASPRLSDDGIFGPKTRSAVVAFQAREGISQDGIVGRTTWSRLGITIDITHPVNLFPQPTAVSCWSAAATMIVGNMSVGPGNSKLAAGSLIPGPNNVQAFADSLGWTMHYPQTWSVGGLANLLRRGPAWAVGGGTSPLGQWLHAIVLSGLWSDAVQDGSGTMIRIHDPWPPNVGSVYGRIYRGTGVDGFDFITLYVLQP
jgi:Putative peptidoglycan binding domain/Papain-like cysteine protease AvrRpt2